MSYLMIDLHNYAILLKIGDVTFDIQTYKIQVARGNGLKFIIMKFICFKSFKFTVHRNIQLIASFNQGTQY